MQKKKKKNRNYYKYVTIHKVIIKQMNKRECK